jgi:arginase
MKVSVIAVPFDSGLRDTRMGRGPHAVLSAGLVDELRARGAEVQTTVVAPPNDLFASEIPMAAALQRAVAEQVAAARREGAFPLVLSGNCNSAVGTVSGMLANGEAMPAVLWFDAHADFNTPDTTVSGFLDGMAVAMLTGHCWRTLAQTVPGFRPMPASHVVLIGTRDVDPIEEELLQSARIIRLPVAGLSDRLAVALDSFASDQEIYVHVDLDVLDPSEGRVNAYAAPHGLSQNALRDALVQIRQRGQVGAAAFTAYDPDGDPERRIAKVAVELAALLCASPAG